MNKSNHSRETRDPASADHPGQGDWFGNSRPTAKRAHETRSEVFEKYHFNGLNVPENDREIYPEYHGEGSPHESVHCEVCGQPKADCAC